MPLDNLFLEISEKLPIPIVDNISKDQHPIEAFREKLYQYMDLGIRFSIDDFGVGYASSSRCLASARRVSRSTAMRCQTNLVISHLLM